MKKTVTLKNAIKQLKVDVSYIYMLGRAGKLKVNRKVKPMEVDAVSLEKFIKERSKRAKKRKANK